MINNYKKRKGLKHSLWSILVTGLCLLTFNNVKAQVSTLDFSTSVQSYSSLAITAGTVISASSTDDDNNYTPITIPFTFNYGGNTFTSVGVSANGYCKLGGSTTTYYSVVCGSQTNTIAAFNLDLQGKGLSTSDIRYQVFGTSPNRTMVIQWRDWCLYQSVNNSGETYNFQIRLSEGASGQVQIVYGVQAATATIAPQVGLSGNVVTDFAIRTNSTSWASTTAGTGNTTTMTHSSTNKPDSGRTYTFANIPMVLNSVTSVQTTGNAAIGTNNNAILAAVANASGNLNPKVVYGIDFNTTGSQNLSTNVSAARVLYTGNVSTFSSGAVIRQFGSTITFPSGTLNFTSIGDTLRSGDNYYWLVYDVNSTANNGDTLDGRCIGFTDSIFRVPTVTNPAGYKIIAGALSGVYTIGGSGSRNYATFAAAIADLVAVGLAGPVTFNVAAGTYPQVIVPPTAINNASAINTITFDGIAPATRIISTSTASQAALILNGCKYYTFKNFTIQNTVASSATGVGIVGTATTSAGSCNTIKGCTILLPNVSTNTAYGILASFNPNGWGSSPTACAIDSITLDSNTITGGGTSGIYYGITVYGAQNTLYNRGIVVTRNTLTLGYNYGFYITYIYNPIKINYNTINMNTTYGYMGMYNYYNQSTSTTVSNEYIGNKVLNFGGYGIYMYFNGSGGTTSAPLKVYNNVVDNGISTYGGYYGIYLYNTGNTEYYHNTTRMTYPAGSTSYAGLYYSGGVSIIAKNNVFSCGATASTSVPVYFSTSPSTGFVNYNLYYNAANTTLLYRNGVLTSSSYKTTTGGGDSSFFTTVSPFVSNTNLSLSNGCFGKGVNLTSIVPLDLTGYTRNTPPDLGAYEFTGGAAGDLSLDKLITPAAPITLGSQDVIFRVKNLGNTAVTSFDASYKLNGGTAVSQFWSGTLNVCDTVSVTFTSGNQVTLGSSNAFKVYTSNPNFSADPNRSNDTVSVNLLAPMIGAYTINPSAAVSATNFQSFATADAALTASGIAGPVSFAVAAGTYTSRIIINGPITGASTVNTVTFDGVSASTRILASSQAVQSVVQFIGCKYVTFKNFTINNTYTSNCTGVGINSSNITLKNNIINMTSGTTTTTSYGVNITNDASGYGSTSCGYDSIYVDSNVINGGYYGIQLYANTSGAPTNYFIKYRWNTITGSYYSGIYHYYGNSGTEFIGNQISMNTLNTSNQYAIYFYGYNSSSTNPPTSNKVINNVINNASYMGMYIYYPYGSSTDPSQIYNNMVLGGFRYSTAAYGIYLYNTSYTNVYHNTVNMDHPNTTSTNYSAFYSSGTSLVNVKNNIFMVTGAGGTANCVYFGTAPSGNVVNYNVYYNTANTNIIYRGSQYTNLTYKTTTAGGDSSSYGLSPFVNFATRNLHLNNGCTGRGVNLTSLVSSDFEGDVRSTTPNIGADEYVGGSSNDLSLDALLTPVFPIVAGSNTVSARIRNVGGNTVSSFDLSYSVNGGTPVSTSWFGTLNACDTTSVILSTPFTVVSGTIYTLKVYTSNPNFSTDPNRGNDTSITQVVTPMHGVYTIGATASDFTTFNNAAAALQSRGVDGPVTFNVKTGTYVESVNMTNASGVSAVNNITFQSAANNRDSVIIAPATSAAYIWQFTSASYIKLNKITLRSTSTVSNQNGINIVGSSSFDTITDSKIDMAVQNSYTNYAVYGTGLNSSCNGMTFKNNIVNGSYYGIYVYGTTNTLASRFWNFTFDNNTLANTYAYGFYSYYSQGIKFTNNTVTTSSLYSGQIYYYMYADSFTFSGNKFNLLNNMTMYIGYYSINGNGITGRRGLVANNSFFGGGTGGTTIYMGYQSTNLDYVNNTFNIYSTSQAAYVYNSGSTGLVFKNNIFSNRTTGSAVYFNAIPTATTALMDYNNYYSNGGSLTSGASTQTTIPAWRTTCSCEKNGLTYRPAVTSVTDNTPNPADTAVWVMNGRGEFLPYLTTDINGNARPATIVDGAPDLGAYNVNPGITTLAPRATASPATPTAGTTQVFTLGNDTVASIMWDAFTTPPATIAVRQYSGAKPKQIGSTVPNYPYFYTDIQATAGSYLYDVKVNYRNNWMGTLYTTFGFTEDYMRLANKETSLAWNTNSGSTVDTLLNVLTGTSFTNATNLFTGSDIFNPLPVKLTTFTGSLLNADAKLTWSTASEINSSNFVVERSIDGKYFEAITNVKAAGNSSSLKSYNHLDKGIITLLNSAGTIYYRLKMVDLDGSFSYSKTIEIRTIENTKEKVTVTPNPFTTDLTINVETVNNANGTVEISDINGRVIVSQNIEVVKGSSTITVNSVEKLKQGIYFVRYTTETGTQVFKMLKN